MNKIKLAADFNPPYIVAKSNLARFYFNGNKKPYPRVRYRLDYTASNRLFTLTKFIKLRSGGSKEMRRNIHDPDVINVFRSALTPEHVAFITRLSMEIAAGVKPQEMKQNTYTIYKDGEAIGTATSPI